MGRKTAEVNTEHLRLILASLDGQFDNRTQLWGAVTEQYNKDCGNFDLKPVSVTTLIKLVGNYDYKTPKGKRGRSIGEGTTNGVRVSRAEKITNRYSNDPQYQQHITYIDKNFGDKPVLLNAIKKGSLRACVKAKCIDCSNHDRNSVKDCTVYSCPLWVIRPYQGTK